MHRRQFPGGGNQLAAHTMRRTAPSQPSSQMLAVSAVQYAGKESFSERCALTKIIHERFPAPSSPRNPATNASLFQSPATRPAQSIPLAKNARETPAPLSSPPALAPPKHPMLRSPA